MPLQSIPTEILAQIAGLLDTTDLLNLRLTCSTLKAKSLHEFGTRCFGLRRFMISSLSLQTLVKIAQNEELGPFLHTLVIGVDDLPDGYQDAIKAGKNSKNPERQQVEVLRKRAAYEAYMKDQRHTRESGLGTVLLKTALQKLTNCRKVCIHGSEGEPEDYTWFGPGDDDDIGVELNHDIGIEPDDDTQSEPDDDTQSEPDDDTQSEPDDDTQSEPDDDTQSEPDDDTQSEPDDDTGIEPDDDTGIRPDDDTGIEPDGDTGIDPGPKSYGAATIRKDTGLWPWVEVSASGDPDVIGITSTIVLSAIALSGINLDSFEAEFRNCGGNLPVKVFHLVSSPELKFGNFFTSLRTMKLSIMADKFVEPDDPPEYAKCTASFIRCLTNLESLELCGATPRYTAKIMAWLGLIGKSPRFPKLRRLKLEHFYSRADSLLGLLWNCPALDAFSVYFVILTEGSWHDILLQIVDLPTALSEFEFDFTMSELICDSEGYHENTLPELVKGEEDRDLLSSDSHRFLVAGEDNVRSLLLRMIARHLVWNIAPTLSNSGLTNLLEALPSLDNI